MPKIKPTDVTSGSEKVKSLFKIPMADRTDAFLKKITFSEEELIEITKLVEMEKGFDPKGFLERVLLSQSGPFTSKVFFLYMDKASIRKDSLLHLLSNTTGLEDSHKKMIMTRTWGPFTDYFLPNFYVNGECKKYGIDVKKSPFNLEFSKQYMMAAGTQSTQIHKVDFSQYHDFFFEIVQTLTDPELSEWYTTLKRMGEDTKEEILKHEKCPAEIFLTIYRETGNSSYLPQDIIDLFIFKI